jgi:hypothetical protein
MTALAVFASLLSSGSSAAAVMLYNLIPTEEGGT